MEENVVDPSFEHMERLSTTGSHLGHDLSVLHTTGSHLVAPRCLKARNGPWTVSVPRTGASSLQAAWDRATPVKIDRSQPQHGCSKCKESGKPAISGVVPFFGFGRPSMDFGFPFGFPSQGDKGSLKQHHGNSCRGHARSFVALKGLSFRGPQQGVFS